VLWYLEVWCRDIWRPAHKVLGARQLGTVWHVLRGIIRPNERVPRIVEVIVSLVCSGESDGPVIVRVRW
jgi:hypothetical protein